MAPVRVATPSRLARLLCHVRTVTVGIVPRARRGSPHAQPRHLGRIPIVKVECVEQLLGGGDTVVEHTSAACVHQCSHPGARLPTTHHDGRPRRRQHIALGNRGLSPGGTLGPRQPPRLGPAAARVFERRLGPTPWALDVVVRPASRLFRHLYTAGHWPTWPPRRQHAKERCPGGCSRKLEGGGATACVAPHVQPVQFLRRSMPQGVRHAWGSERSRLLPRPLLGRVLAALPLRQDKVLGRVASDRAGSLAAVSCHCRWQSAGVRAPAAPASQAGQSRHR